MGTHEHNQHGHKHSDSRTKLKHTGLEAEGV